MKLFSTLKSVGLLSTLSLLGLHSAHAGFQYSINVSAARGISTTVSQFSGSNASLIAFNFPNPDPVSGGLDVLFYNDTLTPSQRPPMVQWLVGVSSTTIPSFKTIALNCNAAVTNRQYNVGANNTVNPAAASTSPDNCVIVDVTQNSF